MLNFVFRTSKNYYPQVSNYYAQDRYKNLSEEEREKKRQYLRDRNKNLSEEEKQKKVERMRNYYLLHKI